MTVREFLESHPNVTIDDNLIGEGYGDGWIHIKDCLDEEIQNLYYNEKQNYAEIYI